MEDNESSDLTRGQQGEEQIRLEGDRRHFHRIGGFTTDRRRDGEEYLKDFNS